MSSVTPYSGRFAGYKIDKGKTIVCTDTARGSGQ
jgi:hypothetical protein